MNFDYSDRKKQFVLIDENKKWFAVVHELTMILAH